MLLPQTTRAMDQYHMSDGTLNLDKLMDYLHQEVREMSLIGRMLKGFGVLQGMYVSGNLQEKKATEKGTIQEMSKINSIYGLTLLDESIAIFGSSNELIYMDDNGINKAKLARSGSFNKMKSIVTTEAMHTSKVVTFLARDTLNPNYLLTGFQDGHTEILNYDTLKCVYNSAEKKQASDAASSDSD